MRLVRAGCTFIIITMSATSFAFAECKDIRLDQDPQVLGKVPAWQQGKTLVCPAYAAVQLFDAYRFSHGDKSDVLTSPLETGIGSSDFLHYGGYIQDSLSYLQENGICDSKKVSEFVGSANGRAYIESLNDIYSEGKGQKKSALKLDKISSLSNTSKSKAVTIYEDDAATRLLEGVETATPFSMANQPASKPRKPQPPKEKIPLTGSQLNSVEKTICYLRKIGIAETFIPLKSALEEWISLDRRLFIRKVTQAICQTRIKVPNMPLATTSDFYSPQDTPPSDENRVKAVKNGLSDLLAQKQPVGIEFCNEAVTDRRHVGSYNERGEWTCKKNGQHGAVVVGSKPTVFGKCEYLVRDSYCTEYQGRQSRKGEVSLCVKGQYWISEDVLAANTRALVHY